MPFPAPSHLIRTIAAIGESDCEQLESGFLAQPVNAVTSLGFSVVGLALVGWARAAHGRERWVRWVFVVGMVATGIGSFLFHGPQGFGSQFLHDITFLTVLAILVTANLGAGLGWTDRTVAWAFSVAVVVGSTILLASPGITNLLTGVAVVGVVAGDIALFGRSGRASAWYLTSLALLVLAVVSLLLGRTDAPLCDPASPYQPHGLWHLLSAGALASYAVATGVRRRTSAAESSEPAR